MIFIPFLEVDPMSGAVWAVLRCALSTLILAHDAAFSAAGVQKYSSAGFFPHPAPDAGAGSCGNRSISLATEPAPSLNHIPWCKPLRI